MSKLNYSNLLEQGKISIDFTFYFQSASKGESFKEVTKYPINGLGDFIIKVRRNEKKNKHEVQFFIKLENPSKHETEKYRFVLKNDEQNEVVNIDFFNGEAILSDVIDVWDFTTKRITGELTFLS